MKTNSLPHGSTSFTPRSAGATPSAPATLFVVDDDYLMTHYRLTKGFLNQHARRMGSFGKPRRFLLAYVEAHLTALAAASLKKAGQDSMEVAMEKIERKKHFNQIIDMRLAADEIARSKAKTRKTA